MFTISKPLLFDGAMGTMLQKAGLPAGTPPEKMNLTAPEAVERIHAAYAAAGADILTANPGKTLVIGTHGTALSTILNYFDPSFGCDDFMRIINWMPYIVELDFEGTAPLSETEHVHVEKEYRP